ncbi:hypothetical protein D3C73_1305350 [compost metagenome]
MYTGDNIASHVRGTLLTAINIAITTKLSSRLINADIVPAMTITYFGKFIFLIISPLLTTEVTPLFVTSAKKFHKTIPSRCDTGQ